jgi:hypothetical protein
MAKGTGGLNPARGFGNPSILPEEEMLVLQLMTKLALDIAAEKLSKLYGTRTSEDWHDWLMQQAEQRLYQIEDEEELEAIFLDEVLRESVE